jgi:hypothetical protein
MTEVVMASEPTSSNQDRIYAGSEGSSVAGPLAERPIDSVLSAD